MEHIANFWGLNIYIYIYILIKRERETGYEANRFGQTYLLTYKVV